MPNAPAGWPPCNPKTVAPLRDNKPDMYNYMPTRNVTRDEARARNWTFFYIGEACRNGHQAPRYVSNHNLCVDCARLRDGKMPMGIKCEPNEKPRSQPPGRTPKALAAINVIRPKEPDLLEKKFLVEYVKRRDFNAAAAECGKDPSEFLGRLSYSKVFREAVHILEEENNLVRTTALTEDFEWTDEKRITLMRMYINTGDLQRAMASVSVSNYHFEQELQDNNDFRAGIEQAQERADRHIERIGIGRAIDGDSRLLQKVLAAKNPEYGDKVKLDMNVTHKLTDDQLNTRLAQIIGKLGGSVSAEAAAVIDADFSDPDESGTDQTVRAIGSETPPPAAESNLDLV